MFYQLVVNKDYQSYRIEHSLDPYTNRLDFGTHPDIDPEPDQFLHFSNIERERVLDIKHDY